MLKPLILLFFLSSTSSVANREQQFVVGTIAYRGVEQAQQRWGNTIDYLNQKIPGYQFILKPLSLQQIEQRVSHDQLDFILGNPGLYYSLKHKGLTPISSLINKRKNKGYDQFGAIIFTRADRHDISTLTDLKGKRFGAVSKKAFGGFQMAWRELKSQNIDPFTDFKELKFIGIPMDKIVFQVRDGLLDAGTVRTDLLERMDEKGLIRLSDYKTINAQQYENFPFQVSTRLYPDWIFSKAEKISDELADKISQTLLEITPEHPAAISGHYMGWTHDDRMQELLSLSLEQLSEENTLDSRFVSIDQMMKELKIGPYKSTEK